MARLTLNITMSLDGSLLLGDGVSLFGNLGGDPITLEATRMIASPSVTHLIPRAAMTRA